MTQNPLLANIVKSLSTSLNMHHFPVTQLHLTTQHTKTRFSISSFPRYATTNLKSKKERIKKLTSSEKRWSTSDISSTCRFEAFFTSGPINSPNQTPYRKIKLHIEMKEGERRRWRRVDFTLERCSEMWEREKLVETLQFRARLTYLSVSVSRRRCFFRRLLCRRRLRFAGLRGVLRRSRRTEARGAGDDVQKSSHVSHCSFLIEILCARKINKIN